MTAVTALLTKRKGKRKPGLNSHHLSLLFFFFFPATWYVYGLPEEGIWTEIMLFPPERCHKVLVSHTKAQPFAF